MRAPDPVDYSRRALLLGHSDRAADPPVRPPWAAADFEAACTRCDGCLKACPQAIIVRGDGGFPAIDFTRGQQECTFCGDCVDACPEPAFDRSLEPPWSRVAVIDGACLNRRGVHCQSCAEVCAWNAISFSLAVGAPPRPALDADACSGCGACIAVCPVDAVSISQRETADD